MILLLFFFAPPAPTEIYTLSLHDALPISFIVERDMGVMSGREEPKLGLDGSSTTALILDNVRVPVENERSEEHTSKLQSHSDLVCRLLLEKKKNHLSARQYWIATKTLMLQ